MTDRDALRQRAEAVWLVERQIDGRPHWMAWRGRDRCEWVTDATLADRFDWAVAAHRQARLIARSQQIECVATEHVFLRPAPPTEGAQP